MGNPTEAQKADLALWRVFSPSIMHGDGKAVRGRVGPSSVAVRGLALGGADAYAGPMTKAWFALAVIALVVLAVMGRYEIVPTTRSEGAVILKLDRWTGQTRAYGLNTDSTTGIPVGAYWSRPIPNNRAPQ